MPNACTRSNLARLTQGWRKQLPTVRGAMQNQIEKQMRWSSTGRRLSLNRRGQIDEATNCSNWFSSSRGREAKCPTDRLNEGGSRRAVLQQERPILVNP